jgi:alpha-amylase
MNISTHARRLIYSSAACCTGLIFCTVGAYGQATTNEEARSPRAVSVGVDRVKPPARYGWWNEAVFYQVFVRSFADSREGPLAGDGIGDIAGLISRLDYLNDGDATTTTDLGVTALWLMPMAQSPSYHGYDTIDYRTIEQDYGTNEDFKRLMVECKRRGINVIVDLVLNHCSSEHPWFKGASDPASPHHEWFIWSETNPGYRGPWNQQVWHRPRGGSGSYYYGIFHGNMPDLNYRNETLTSEMLATCAFWLTELNVDGFRLDAIRHLIEDGKLQDSTQETHAWLERFTAEMRRVKPTTFSVGEVWAPTSTAAAYVNGDENGKMDTCFEFDVAGAILEAARTGQASKLAAQLDTTWRSYPDNQFATFLANHDQTRALTSLGGDVSKARLAAGLLLTLPGVPFIYYGEEIGMVGNKPDPLLRTPMQWSAGTSNITQPLYSGFTSGTPWQPPHPDGERVNVAAQAGDPDSLLNYYRKAVKVRRGLPALLRGGYVSVTSESPGVFAFMRTGTSGSALVIANLTGEEITAYSLTFSGGLPEGNYSLGRELMLESNLKNITLSQTGAFTSAAPLPVLAARSVYVVEIVHSK